MRRDCRARLEGLRTGDGRPLPPRLKAGIGRELDRLELVRRQMAAVEAERVALVQEELPARSPAGGLMRSGEHTSELQSRQYLVMRLLLEKKRSFIDHRRA